MEDNDRIGEFRKGLAALENVIRGNCHDEKNKKEIEQDHSGLKVGVQGTNLFLAGKIVADVQRDQHADLSNEIQEGSCLIADDELQWTSGAMYG